MQLARQFKTYPQGTQVTLLSRDNLLSTIKIGSHKFMVPNSYLTAIPTDQKQRDIEEKIRQHIPRRILTAEEATRLIRVSCYCGQVTNLVSITARHSDEQRAINEAIAECGKCK